MYVVQEGAVNFWVVSNQFMMELWFTWPKIWTSKGAENIINLQYLVICNLPFMRCVFMSGQWYLGHFFWHLWMLCSSFISGETALKLPLICCITECLNINIACVSWWFVGSRLIQPVSEHPNCQSDQLLLNPLENERFQISELLTAFQENVSTRSFNVPIT